MNLDANPEPWECGRCGRRSAVQLPRCPRCRFFGSYTNQSVSKELESAEPRDVPVRLAKVRAPKVSYVPTNVEGLDEALGGGWVAGCVYLLAGVEGSGKSTLVLQTIAGFEAPYYVAGEEAPEKIKRRMKRLGIKDPGVTTIATDSITTALDAELDEEPDLLVVDSSNVVTSDDADGLPGSISQMRAVIHEIVQYTREVNCVSIVIAHATKDGNIAGPRTVAHMVDAPMFFDIDLDTGLRHMTIPKNRNGPAPARATFRMTERGLFAPEPT